MYLEDKPDLEKTLQRFEAWWMCEIVDRPPVSLSVKDDRREVKRPAKKVYATQRERWLDINQILDGLEAAYSGRRFVGDTLPTFMPNVGPDVCATVYGAELEFGENTSWSKPVAASCAEVLRIEPNLDAPYWAFVRKLTLASIERGRGKWITGYTDLHPNGDLLAALRDPQELLLEMAEDPASVKQAMGYITPHFKLMFDDLYQPIHAAGLPTVSWIPCPHAGRMNISSCDLICMISPELFEEMILPALQWEMGQVERSIFHLDGPGAVRHLDALMACGNLHAIQWVAGAGNGPASKWAKLYQRIQAGGKAQQIICEDIGEARKLMQELKPEGCWFSIGGSYEVEEAEAFLEEVERWAGKTTRRD